MIHFWSAFSCLLVNQLYKAPDEKYKYFLTGALYQRIDMYKGSPFNPPQSDLVMTALRVIVFDSGGWACS